MQKNTTLSVQELTLQQEKLFVVNFVKSDI